MQRRNRIGPTVTLLEHANRVVIVDHHVDMESDIQEATNYVVDKVGSVLTLIVERLMKQQREQQLLMVNGNVDAFYPDGGGGHIARLGYSCRHRFTVFRFYHAPRRDGFGLGHVSRCESSGYRRTSAVVIESRAAGCLDTSAHQNQLYCRSRSHHIDCIVDGRWIDWQPSLKLRWN
jgi:hypothetical protein